MAYSAEIIADSVNPYDNRLTTFEITLPRIVLAEFNTHRMLSRNSASSRAIPVEKQLGRVLDDPFIPVEWGINQAGMQAGQQLAAEEVPDAEAAWLHARDLAVLGAVTLIGGIGQLGDEALRDRIADLSRNLHYQSRPLQTPLHKQIANRLLEPFMWHTIIATGTEWSNFFALRANPMAQPEIQKAAYMMLDAYVAHQPRAFTAHEWHLPLIQPEERDLPIEDRVKIAVGRCARVSYLTHDGKRNPAQDIALHDRLLRSGHLSPFEHVARPMKYDEGYLNGRWSGNFQGWHQYRKDIPFENDFSLIPHEA